MALRLIEIVGKEEDGEEILELLKEQQLLEHRQLRLPDAELLVRILVDTEKNEADLDLLAQHYKGREGHRIVILPVKATLPRAEPEPAVSSEQMPAEEKLPQRVSPTGLAARVVRGISKDNCIGHATEIAFFFRDQRSLAENV